MLNYAVLYQSNTGNTRQVAAEIFKNIPSDSKDLISINDMKEMPKAENYFIGFNIHKGICSMEIIDILQSIHNKTIILFATCGMSPTIEYRRSLENRIKIWISEDNFYLGMFLCQGKLPIEVRNEYEKKKTDSNRAEMERMLSSFYEAMVHPNESDLRSVGKFTETMVARIQSEQMERTS